MQTIAAKGVGRDQDKWYRVLEFDSIDEFLDESAKRRNKNEASSAKGDGYGFYNSKTYEKAWNLAHDGWQSVRPKVEVTLEAIRERLRDIVSPTEVRVHDIVGYEPDIDRFVSGEIECMWDDMMIEAPHDGRVFTVLLDASLSAHQDKDEILKRGAAVIALVEAFQLFGFELEIWVEQTVHHMGLDYGKAGELRPDYHTTLVRINRAGERPDINAIMFPLGNPDWLRRLIFGVEEGEPAEVRRRMGFGPEGYGYGQPRQGAHMGKRVEASIEISFERADGRMVDDPVGFIVAQLKAQGVIPDDDD